MRRMFALVLTLSLIVCGCVRTVPEETAVPAQEPTQESIQKPTQAPTQAPTEAPTEPKPEWLLHSGIREDGSFNRGTLFIGDSLTYDFLRNYLTQNELLGEAWYMAMPGAALTAYFEGPRFRTNSRYYSFFSEGFEGMTMGEGVEAAGKIITAVYLMMGTNHMDGVTEQLYVDVVGHILENCPKATVYLQRIPYSYSSKVDPEAANARIEYAYEYYADQGETRVRLIDTQTAIDYNLTEDGIHLTAIGQEKWYQAILAYAEENEIPQ